MAKNQVKLLGKSSCRKRQDEALQKEKIDFDLNLPKWEVKSRIVGLNTGAVMGLVLVGSLLFNWRLYKKMEGLDLQVANLAQARVSVEVKNSDHSVSEHYLNSKLANMKEEIINSLLHAQKGRSDFNVINRLQASSSRSLMPSAIELINQIDMGQYNVTDPEQYGNFRRLLSSLSRMHKRYRKEVQAIVSAYSNTHQITGVDRGEYNQLLERRREVFDQINDLHEQVKRQWKVNKQRTAKM